MSNLIVNIRFWYWHLQVTRINKKITLSQHQTAIATKAIKDANMGDEFVVFMVESTEVKDIEIQVFTPDNISKIKLEELRKELELVKRES